jgi:thiol-disulfide isomerase/thioredoxin
MKYAWATEGPAPQAGSVSVATAAAESATKKEAVYTRTVADGEHTLTLTTRTGQEEHLLAKDQAGKAIFDGPVATEEQRAKLPADIASKLELLQQKLPVVEEDAPAAEPEATLHIGDPAPNLMPATWLKGDAVTKFEPGKIYVVEFWATWCGPCIASIPHLTELQKKNADVTVIGMAASEEDPSAAAPFVKKMGDKMGYRVAQGDEAHSVGKAWLDASGQAGIPAAFVIGKDAKIAWIGHPMELDGVVKQVVAGTFDAKKAAAAAAVAAAETNGLEEQLNKAVQSGDVAAIDKLAKAHPERAAELQSAQFSLLVDKKDVAAAIALGRQLVENQKDNVNLLNFIAFAMVDPERAIDKPDLDLALKAALRAKEASSGDEQSEVLTTLARVYFVRGDVDKAIEVQTQAIETSEAGNVLREYRAKKVGARGAAVRGTDAPAQGANQNPPESGADIVAATRNVLQKKEYRDNPHILNLAAWSMVDPENLVDKPDLDLALQVALRANDISKGQHSGILDTLARVHFTRGEVDKAIAVQMQAVAKAAASEKEVLMKTLSEYKSSKAGRK